jgi:hypothetical protein
MLNSELKNFSQYSDCGLGDHGLVPGKDKDFSLISRVQTICGTRSAPCSVRTVGCLPWSEAAGA